MLVLNAQETADLLDRDELRVVVGRAMVEVSAGRVSMPPRVGARNEEVDGLMGVMAAFVPALEAMATKLVTVYPGNAGTGLPTHQGIVIVVEPGTGEILGLVDGDTITAERTAAGSALSTELLAREESTVMAVLGTGVQARSHVLAVSRVRPFREIRIAGRDGAKVARLAAEMAPLVSADVVATAGYREACIDADVVCATTDSPDPVVERSNLSPGTHVAAVGFSGAGRELDSATVADSLLVVESADSAFAPYPVGSNDLRMPLEEGLITADHVHAELGELVAGDKPGRTAEDQLTLYKSVGVGAQDAAAAKLVFDAAVAAGVGVPVAR